MLRRPTMLIPAAPAPTGARLSVKSARAQSQLQLLRTRLLPGLLLLALTAGCALTEPIVRPDLDLPAQWAEAGGAPAATAPVHDTWWRDFGSAPLDALVAEALATAPDLRIQAERVVQAELALRQAGASLLPGLDLSAGSGARNVDSNETNSTSLSLGAS